MIRYDSGHWPSSRRCGCICFSDYYTPLGIWYYQVASNNGGYDQYEDSYEHRCNCSIKYGIVNTNYELTRHCVALCASAASESWDDGPSNIVDKWLATNSYTCPKGWGKLKWRYPDDTYSVQFAQGYSKSGTNVPVYGYVTRYRNAYYNYIAGRVSKA